MNGWEVQVVEGKQLVVARGGAAGNYADAFKTGLAHAQMGLDLLSLRGSNNVVVKAFEDDHLAWWLEPNGLVIRMVSFAPIRFDVPPATVIAKDQKGNVVSGPATPPVIWHESFRYFRLSQTTDDLFDAYRNAYLALESILSALAPQSTDAAGKVNEGEGAWFRRALVEADKIVPLSSVVPPGTPDPVQHLFDELFVDMRSAMSHAKSGRRILLPQDEQERDSVVASLQRLVGLYLRLAEAYLGARRPGGGVFAIAFRMMVSPMLAAMTAYVSDDESPFNPSDTSPTPAGGEMRELAPIGAPIEVAPFAMARLWSGPAADLEDLPFIRRMVGLRNEEAVMASVLEGRLELGLASRLEVMLGLRGSNVRQPRERYAS